jgi:hypothetical protein
MSKITVIQEGPNRGMWVRDERGTLAIVHQNEGKTVYVCAYPRETQLDGDVSDSSANPTKLPYALSFDEAGVLMLQIPGATAHDTPVILPMSEVAAKLRFVDRISKDIHDTCEQKKETQPVT